MIEIVPLYMAASISYDQMSEIDFLLDLGKEWPPISNPISEMEILRRNVLSQKASNARLAKKRRMARREEKERIKRIECYKIEFHPPTDLASEEWARIFHAWREKMRSAVLSLPLNA